MNRTTRVIAVLGSLFTALCFSSCAPSDHQAPQANPHHKAALIHAVEALESGDLVQQLNLAQEQGASIAPVSVALSTTEDAAPRSVIDSCPTVSRPDKNASQSAMLESLQGLAQCFQGHFAEVVLWQQAMVFFKTFVVDQVASPIPLSEMTTAQLQAFLSSGPKSLRALSITPTEWNKKFRVRYTEEELDELWFLALKRNAAAKDFEAKVYAAVDLRMDVILAFSTLDRYSALLALKETAADVKGDQTFRALEQATHSKFAWIAGTSRALLHPFALLAVVPSPGQETSELAVTENPYLMAKNAQLDLAGDAQSVKSIFSFYSEARDLDNRPMPDHPRAASNAVRVALLDTGIDFLNYKDLALFTGRGKDGELSQHDFSDFDLNPWMPARGILGHGTGTTATLLSFLARYDRELLMSHQIDLAMWKTASLRSALAGDPYASTNRFDARDSMAVVDTLVNAVEKDVVKPQIVSMSMTLQLGEWLGELGKADTITRAPWLWVMAAGNDPDHSMASTGGCFQDLKPSVRPDQRILCVGALNRGIVFDSIAHYSVRESRVDVYAYESYHKLCPNGTSCATPAVASAAVVLQAKFPKAKPEQLRDIIMGASEYRELEVDLRPGQMETGELKKRIKVRVFDPETMMDRAIKLASRVSAITVH